MAVSFNANTDAIWNYFSSRINNDYGVAGLMGNLWAESGCNPINVQNSSGWTDEAYTNAVNDGTYTNFVNDSIGYGIAQWTFSTRKQALYDLKVQMGVSIGDLNMQMDYLWYELQNNYSSTLTILQNATSIRQASDEVLFHFENPSDQSEAVQLVRFGYSSEMYEHYSGTPPTPPTPPIPAGSKMPFIFMCGSKRQKVFR